MKEWKNRIIQSDEVKALPIMTYPGLALAGKTVLEIITDGESQSKCIEALSKRYNSLAASTVMDLSVEAEAFGSKATFSEVEVPAVSGKIIENAQSAGNLEVPSIGAGRTSVYIEAAKLLAHAIRNKPVLGGHIGPFSLAGRLMDMTEIMMMLIEDPDVVHTVLEKCTQFLCGYAAAFKDAGANGIIIAEPVAGLLSPQMCDEFSSKYVRRIVEAVQDDSFMVVLHNCGNTVKLVNSLVSTKAMALHFGNAVVMKDIMPQIPPDVLAMGNINPAGIFKNGTAEEMEQTVLDLLQSVKGYKNFILSSGCDIPPGTSLGNVDAFFSALDKFNRENK
jgi:uroporphyrinogen decarboxylase